MTGALLREGMLDNQDNNGMTLRQVLQRHGFSASEDAIAAIAMDPSSVRGFDPPSSFLVFGVYFLFCWIGRLLV